MIRRLFLLLLLIPSLAEARGLVIVNRVRNSAFTAAVTSRQEWQADYAEMLTRQLLDRMNVAYDIVPASQVRTEDCRTGSLVRGVGTQSATATQYQWVLHVAYPGKLCKSGRWPYPNYRPDSLHISDPARGPCLVPQLFWNMQINSATPAAFLADTTGDTTGFQTGTLGLNGPNSCQFPPYAVDYAGHKFLESSYISSPGMDGSGALSSPGPAYGFRLLHGKRLGGTFVVTGMESYMFSNPAVNACSWADSNANFAAVGSGVGAEGEFEIWEQDCVNKGATAKPLVFAQVWGISGCTDSTGTSTATPCEWDSQNALLSLARIDSLTSGGVFGRTLQLGCVIKGGFNRSGIGNPGGISPSDTTALKATLDSLGTLGSRFRCVVTADMDSVWARTSEKTWWEKLPGVRYAPVVTACSGDSSDQRQCRGATGSKWLWQEDVFGHFRKRAAFGVYQDSTYVYDNDSKVSSSSSDSSLYFQLRSLFFHADSIFRPERVSHFLIPPGDDFSPLFNSALTQDSLFSAMQRAGASGILFNSQKRTTPSLMIGLPGIGEERIINTIAGKPFLLLGYSGMGCNGGRKIFDVRSDSTTWSSGSCMTNGFNRPQYTYPSLPAYEVHRAINALLFTRYRDYDFMMRAQYTDPFDDVTTPVDDAVFGLRRGSVWVTSAQDLGAGGLPTAIGTRPSWWTIKSLDQFMLAVNAWAGRTVVKWDWPENIVP